MSVVSVSEMNEAGGVTALKAGSGVGKEWGMSEMNGSGKMKGV
jgi:hypothetical protein